VYIKRLRINNYRVYPGDNIVEFKDPNPNSKLNCYLFGGLNGSGKTSLLQAIVIGLYGVSAEGIVFDRSRGENLQKVYPQFLEEAFSHKARADGESEMQTEVVLQDGGDEISITRTWWFHEDGHLQDEGIEIWKNGNPLKVAVPDDTRLDVLQEYIDSLIPHRVAKFFFFDGEEIKSISERDPSSAVIEGLDGLLGFNTLSRLDEDLDKILREIQTQVADSPSKAQYLRAMAECDELTDKQAGVEEELSEVKRKVADEEAEAARIDERLNSIFHGATVQESSEIIDRISEMEGEVRTLTNEIGRFVGDLLYLALPTMLLSATSTQLEGELSGRTWATNKEQLDPQRDRVSDRLFGPTAPPPDPVLTKGQPAFFRRRFVEEWTQMFYPPPEGVPERALFDEWPPGVLEEAFRHRSEIETRTRQELETRIGKRNRIERELQKLRLAHKQFQVGPEAQQAIDRKSELAASLAELGIQMQNLQREITALTSEIGNANAQVARLAETVSQTESTRRRYETAREMRNTVRGFMDELRQRRVSELGRRMTDMMGKLAHKDDLVSKISIDPATYVLRILNSKGEEVQSPSAGEREVFALSMLWGLAQISKRNLPVIIDTPLGRLDQSHRSNIVHNYFPRAGEQVIILSTDAEIDETWYKALRPSLVQEFALENDDFEEVTTIIADHYFDFA
jgi:DNA sulfur modification protein DndD